MPGQATKWLQPQTDYPRIDSEFTAIEETIMRSSTTRIILLILALALASLACSFTFDIPGIDILPGDGSYQRGPLVTEEISIDLPQEEPIELHIGFGAGELYLEPGAEGLLVEGTASYDVEQLAPETEISGGRVALATGNIDSLDDFHFNLDLGENPFSSGFEDLENRWDLRVASVPMAMEIAGGAYQGRVELGGLSLTDLTISSGASDLEVNFSEPNMAEMGLLQVSTGASSTGLYGLANAHFERMEFSGGAGDFNLDFSGELSQDAAVSIDAALSSLTLIIPEGVPTQISISGALANVDMASGFSRSGDSYSQEGSGPKLTIEVELGAGDLQIERP
jgi:hypothetical protein